MKPTLEQIESKQSELEKMIKDFKKEPSYSFYIIPEQKFILNKGEHYAGIILNDEGQPSHHLILLPRREEKDLNWSDAKAWAESVGGELPTRKEQSLLFANLKDEFDKKWHWSCEAEGTAYAWLQLFYDGGQNCCRTSVKSRARAVRRLEIY